MKDLPPNTFTEHPFSSTLAKREAETVARNINVIRVRLGDKWPLTITEYKHERKKDGGLTASELAYFKEVMPLISSDIDCIAFSPEWAQAAKRAAKKATKKAAK